jgi:hypothetical protein
VSTARLKSEIDDNDAAPDDNIRNNDNNCKNNDGHFSGNITMIIIAKTVMGTSQAT